MTPYIKRECVAQQISTILLFQLVAISKNGSLVILDLEQDRSVPFIAYVSERTDQEFRFLGSLEPTRKAVHIGPHKHLLLLLYNIVIEQQS